MWVGTKIFWGSQRVGPVFFQWVKGGPDFFIRVTDGDLINYVRGCCFTGDQIFLRMPGGGQNIFAHAKEGPEKMASGDYRQIPPTLINLVF